MAEHEILQNIVPEQNVLQHYIELYKNRMPYKIFDFGIEYRDTLLIVQNHHFKNQGDMVIGELLFIKMYLKC